MGSKSVYYYIRLSLFLTCLIWFNPSVYAQSEAKAKLFLSPSNKSFEVEDTFSVRIGVDTAGQSINLVQASLSFSADVLEVLRLNKNGSFFQFWFEEPKFSNTAGTIGFSGGIPNPGFDGSGQVLEIVFQAKKDGQGWLKFTEAQILANDGKGTNIYSGGSQGSYVINKSSLPRPVLPGDAGFQFPVLEIRSPSHPDQNKTYPKSDVIFNWNWQAGISNYSFILDKEPETVPDDKPEGNFTSTSYAGVADGQWFFHLKALVADRWTKTAHYQIKIDSSLPDENEVAVNPEEESHPAIQPNPTETHQYIIQYWQVPMKVIWIVVIALTLCSIFAFTLYFLTLSKLRKRQNKNNLKSQEEDKTE